MIYRRGYLTGISNSVMSGLTLLTFNTDPSTSRSKTGHITGCYVEARSGLRALAAVLGRDWQRAADVEFALEIDDNGILSAFEVL
jgi:hypothetical protein